MAAQGLPPSEKEPRLYGSLTAIIIRLISLAALDAFALWFLYELVSDEVWFLAITIVVVTLAINVVFLNDRLYPFRWFSPGLALMILMVAYPTLFTIYTAFTNYSTGNLLTENRAIERIEEKPEYRYLPEGQQAYHWLRSSYRNPEGDYLLWLVGYQDGRVLVAREGEELRSPTPEESGLEGVTFNPAGDIPLELAGHEYLAPSEAATELADTKYLMFGEPIGVVQVAAIDDETQAEGYVYDPAQALLADYSRRGQRSPAILYRDIEDQSYALWIADEEPMLAPEGVPLSAADLQAGFDCCQLPRLPTVEAAAVTVTPPDMIGEYEKLSIGTITREGLTQELPQIRFGETDDPLYVNANANDQAGRFRQLYSYDEERGVMVNRVTEDIYEPVEGTFTLQRTLQEGEETPVELSPGYYTVIGLDNFDRLITDERLRDPFVRIFLWTFAHAFLAVFLTFSLG
ncbi:MAG: hypothetical protein GYB66_16110, partial [Chloroflexi bacterium]|nr:hypothetical protein [Chloroflexota bacterium]